jgi:hypothetical protein
MPSGFATSFQYCAYKMRDPIETCHRRATNAAGYVALLSGHDVLHPGFHECRPHSKPYTIPPPRLRAAEYSHGGPTSL